MQEHCTVACLVDPRLRRVCVRCVAETCHASLHNVLMYCRKVSALLLLPRGRGNSHKALMDKALTASGSQASHRSLGETARAWASPPPKSRGASTMSNASVVRRRDIWPRCDNKSRCVSFFAASVCVAGLPQQVTTLGGKRSSEACR